MNQKKINQLKTFREMGFTLLKPLNQTIHFILAIGMALIMFAVVFHVFGRYFFGKTYMGSMELIRYTMIWVSMLGTAAAFGVKEHPCIVFLQDKMTAFFWFWINITGYLMLCVFLIVMIKGGFAIALRNWHQTSLGLQIPMFFPYLAIPVGGLVMFPYIIMDLLNSTIDLLEKKERCL